ncbi:Spo0B domain-containing protein [Desulfotruncus alcoholivorax]|uniref:Spo0B domain-containing protein n=1 Tax=Desulfotruncus alcoholivorax TaxID=265477 RepID=UPI000403E383|nr:Spo0B domain-containing protein [Desulfotruncus alcoholivorax]
MDTDKMLELISIQRHDFLNHLQVISGLLQLKKEERAREYIYEIGQDIKRLSKISHLKDPEAAAAFLIGHNHANSVQVAVNYDVQTDLAECDVPGSITGSVLIQLLEYILHHLAPPEVAERELNIDLKAVEGGFQCVFRFAGSGAVNGEAWNELSRVLNKKLAPYAGGLERMANGSHQTVKLFLPAIDA